MRQLIREALNYLKEKWDVYLTIGLAILAGILSLLGYVSNQAVAGLILTILALLGVNILQNRWTDEKMRETIKSIDARLTLESESLISTHLDDAENYIKKYIAERSVQEAIFIQYTIAQELIKHLLNANIKVVVYIQHEDTAKKMGSEQQAFFIQTGYHLLEMGLTKALDKYDLEIYKYDKPCSISGIRLDRDLICMSWYTYEYPDQENSYRLGPYTHDPFLVLGHNRAAIIAKKDFKGFGILEETFNAIEENYRKHASCIFPPKEDTTSNDTALGTNHPTVPGTLT